MQLEHVDANQKQIAINKIDGLGLVSKSASGFRKLKDKQKLVEGYKVNSDIYFGLFKDGVTGSKCKARQK